MSRLLYFVNAASDVTTALSGTKATGSPLVQQAATAVVSDFVVTIVGGGQFTVDLYSPVNVPYAGLNWPTSPATPVTVWAQANVAGPTMSISSISRVSPSGVRRGAGPVATGATGFQAVPTVGAQMTETFTWSDPNTDAARAADDRIATELLVFSSGDGAVTLRIGPAPTAASGGTLDISDFPNLYVTPGPNRNVTIWNYPGPGM